MTARLGAGMAVCLCLLRASLITSDAIAAPAEGCTGVSPRFTVLTTRDDSSIRAGLVVIRFSGAILPPMSDDLRQILASLDPEYSTVLLHLSSPGGSLAEAKQAMETVSAYRGKFSVETFVDHGDTCASACIALFMAGDSRIAHGASAWLFHGACHPASNVPRLSATADYVATLKSAGASGEFLDDLEENYIRYPGEYWLSGHELYHSGANIITRLLPPWQPQEPYWPPFDPSIGPR